MNASGLVALPHGVAAHYVVVSVLVFPRLRSSRPLAGLPLASGESAIFRCARPATNEMLSSRRRRGLETRMGKRARVLVAGCSFASLRRLPEMFSRALLHAGAGPGPTPASITAFAARDPDNSNFIFPLSSLQSHALPRYSGASRDRQDKTITADPELESPYDPVPAWGSLAASRELSQHR